MGGEVKVLFTQSCPIKRGRTTVQKFTLLLPLTLVFPFYIWLCTKRLVEGRDVEFLKPLGLPWSPWYASF